MAGGTADTRVGVRPLVWWWVMAGDGRLDAGTQLDTWLACSLAFYSGQKLFISWSIVDQLKRFLSCWFYLLPVKFVLLHEDNNDGYKANNVLLFLLPHKIIKYHLVYLYFLHCLNSPLYRTREPNDYTHSYLIFWHLKWRSFYKSC